MGASTIRTLAVASLIGLVSAAVPTGADAASSSWARSSLTFSQRSGLLTQGQVHSPARKLRRAEFAAALVALDTWRSNHAAPGGGWWGDTPPTTTDATPPTDTGDPAPAAPGAPAGSAAARALAAGWMVPVHGNFAGSAPITADEAARGMVGVLGLTDSANVFATLLRREVPGANTNYQLRAYEVYVRALGMRYNHLQGTEQLEVAPNEPMSVAHVAYMLDHGANADEWRLQNTRSEYESFDLPDVGPSQRAVLATAIGLVGWPYVWAGETEGHQPEGHGGFDCSGFSWRVLNGTPLPPGARGALGERTSMTMSARGRHIKRIAALQPADLVFFGTRGPRSSPAENYHVGVSMGNGWFVHSSGGNGGVTIQRLDGYWADNFSWGRRVLRRR